MHHSVCMRLESIDPRTFAIKVRCEGERAFDLLGRLSSLAMVAVDCGVPSLCCELPASLPESVRGTALEIARRNPIIAIAENSPDLSPGDEPGSHTIGSDRSFVCVREGQGGDRYSIRIAAVGENIDRASRCAYILAAVLGFSSDTSFEIRLSVSELLGNAGLRGVEEGSEEWVRIDLEREEDALVISIIDAGPASDQTSGARALFRKSISVPRAADRARNEWAMAQFKASEPWRCEDGSHVIRLSGGLDARGVVTMERILAELLERNAVRVTLDLEKVPFITSAGVGILLGIAASLREAGGDAVLARISPKVRSVFRLLGLEDYFTMREPAGSIAQTAGRR